MTLAVFALGWTFWMIGLTLVTYLDLRIHALVQTGDLPPNSPRFWVWTGLFRGFQDSVAGMKALYGAPYRLVDGHTRALVPAIRILLPVGAVLAVLGLLVHQFG